MKHVTQSEKDNEEIVKEFLDSLAPKSETATVVGLYGNLGAGKTTFTKYIAKHFNIEEVVTSPTFVIEKVYELPKKDTEQKFSHFIHIDAYRLEREEELLSLGWSKIISDPKNLIFVEWPEKVSGIMPEHIKISFVATENENSREIDIEETAVV